MKRIQLRDEYGLTWTVIETDSAFLALDSLSLETDEYACWRKDFLKDFAYPEAAFREGLIDLTHDCLAAEEPNDGLLQRFTHAAQAYTTRTLLAKSGANKGTGADREKAEGDS